MLLAAGFVARPRVGEVGAAEAPGETVAPTGAAPLPDRWTPPRDVPPGLAPGIEGSAASSAATTPGRRRDERLEARIRDAIARAVGKASDRTGGKVHSGNVTVGVHVRRLAEPRDEIVALGADVSLRPASNLKLVTSAAALVLLGPGWSFLTDFEALGPIARGVLEGDLVVRAGGDPLYVRDGDGRLDPWLDGLARDLRTAAIERVRGALVLDEGTFESPAPGPAWPDSSEHWQEYCALAGGFSANAGCLTATIETAGVGSEPVVRVGPEHHGLRRHGDVKTVAPGKALRIVVEARGERVTVRGEVPADVRSWSTRFAHPDPVELFGHAVVGGLADRGVTVDGGWRRERDVPVGSRVAQLRTPLTDTLVPILTDSNNSVSDQVFLALGLAVEGEGTRAGGRRAVARALTQLGVSGAGLEQVDGSGLSRDDRVSTRQLTALLCAVLGQDRSVDRLFEEALPVAGESGKLARRMQSTAASGRVRAKTGFIGGTSGLSGVCDTLEGDRLVFSILVSYPTVDGLNTHCFKPMQDEICALLVESDG